MAVKRLRDPIFSVWDDRQDIFCLFNVALDPWAKRHPLREKNGKPTRCPFLARQDKKTTSGPVRRRFCFPRSSPPSRRSIGLASLTVTNHSIRRFIKVHLVHIVDNHFAQWYCDAVEGIRAHPSLVDFPARTELHHLR